MLTEPVTTPPRRYQQVAYGAFVGLLFSSGLSIGSYSMTPEISLIIGNLAVFALARRIRQPLKLVENYLRGLKKLQVIGRYGSFKYNNQDHSILMGMLAAENITSNTKHDLWDINTDYEYQESSVITKTGLSIKEKK